MRIFPTKVKEGHLPLPYFRQVRKESANNGFCNLKRRPEIIAQIEELFDWPEFEKLVRTINAPSSFFPSLGCEKAFCKLERTMPSFETKLTSYIDIAFEVLEVNRDDRSFYDLADRFRKFTEGIPPDDHVVVAFELQKTTYFEHRLEGWSAAFWSTGFGKTEAAARTAWGFAIRNFQDFVIQESERNAGALKSAPKRVSGVPAPS